jgi:hypothetical protein
MHQNSLFVFVTALALALLAAQTAQAQPSLSHWASDGKVALKVVSSGKSKAVLQFSSMAMTTSPLCPATSALRVVSDTGDSGDLNLDCSRWLRKGSSYTRYVYKGKKDSGGGSVKILLSFKKAKVKVKRGASQSPLLGDSVAFVEARLRVDTEDGWCGRFDTFDSNSGGKVKGRSTSIVCPAWEGENAFWDTLNNYADRSQETIDTLGAAVADLPADGRASLLKGMMHVYLVGTTLLDPSSADQVTTDHAALGSAALNQAALYLTEDTRVPGWQGAANYIDALIRNDAGDLADALQLLRDAVALYPLFNTFDFSGVVGTWVEASDPLMAEAIDYMDAALATDCTPFNSPRVCGNAGRAPNNVQGTGLMFGDLFLKGGRSDSALEWYELAELFDDLGDGPSTWPYRSVLDDRIANFSAREALYLDADPSNDPLLTGQGPENCVVCHGS